MTTLRSLAALVWLWVKLTVVMGAVALAAGAVLAAIDPLHDVPYVGRDA